MNRAPQYVIVTPAFNERERIEKTISSMLGQSVPPAVWVLVDDQSTDGTWDLIQRAAERAPWIRAHRHRKSDEPSTEGLATASEARAFLQGLDLALEMYPDAEFVVKLDADLLFDAEYFELLFSEFDRNPRLGIAGGTILEGGGSTRSDLSQNWHVRGATKVFRRRCYDDIGGVRPVLGWDGLDEVMAHQKGWETRSFNPPLMTHLRPTAGRHGRFRGGVRGGKGSYYLDYSGLRTFLRGGYRLAKGDVPLGLGLWWGYAWDWIRRAPRIADPDVRRAVRRQQWKLTPLGSGHSDPTERTV